jgi:hypothetical protein
MAYNIAIFYYRNQRVPCQTRILCIGNERSPVNWEPGAVNIPVLGSYPCPILVSTLSNFITEFPVNRWPFVANAKNAGLTRYSPVPVIKYYNVISHLTSWRRKIFHGQNFIRFWKYHSVTSLHGFLWDRNLKSLINIIKIF